MSNSLNVQLQLKRESISQIVMARDEIDAFFEKRAFCATIEGR